MSRRRSILTLTAVFLAWALVVPAQDAVKTLDRVNSQVAPAASAPAPSDSAPAAGGAPAATAPGGPDDNYLVEGESLYRHMTDRDPFTPLVRGAGGTTDVKVRPGSTGLARFTVESCMLEAIIQLASGTVAWFQAPDGKPYKAVVGERFADGVVLDISYSDGEVVIQQELNDPTAIKPFRNLVLKIRSVEGEGQ